MYLDLTELMRLKGRLGDINIELGNTLNSVSTELENVCNNINSSDLKAANEAIKEKILTLASKINANVARLDEFMGNQLSTYKVSNEDAQASLKELVSFLSQVFTAGGAINMQAIEDFKNGTGNGTSTPPVNNGPDISIYHSNPAQGFVVTTGNKTYEPTDQERQVLYNLVAGEFGRDYDDALGVASTVLNRCDTNYSNNGTTLWSQLSARGQYGTYYQGTVAPWATPERYAIAKRAVDDALAGVRNCQYTNYRSNGSTWYGGYMISAGGNRFGWS